MEFIQNLNVVQWAAIAGAAALIGWPYLSGVVSNAVNLVKPKPTDKTHDLLDELVCLRSHMLDNAEALKAIDEVLMPIAIKKASEK